MNRLPITIAVLTLLSSGPALADQDSQKVRSNVSGAAQEVQHGGYIRGDALLGMNVKTSDGARAGEIKDIAIGPDGRVQYVVLQSGGIAGIGGKTKVIPWNSLSLDTAGNRATLKITEATLQRTPDVELKVGRSQLSFPTGVALGGEEGAVRTEDRNAAFSSLDNNHDGYVTKREAEQNSVLNTRFDSLDQDRDGRLDEGEFARFEVGTGGGEMPHDKGSKSPSGDWENR